MHYLDDLCNYPDATSKVTRAEVREKGQSWIQNSDFSGSLDDAFQVWDAVSRSVKTAILLSMLTLNEALQRCQGCWEQGEG